MKELQIIVAGQANTGKSTVLVMIERFLKEKGFTVEMNLETELMDYGTEDNFRRAMGRFEDKREKSLKHNTKIILTTKQTHRDGQEK